MKPLPAQARVELLLAPRRGEGASNTLVVPPMLLSHVGTVAPAPTHALRDGRH
jgi:hypothetical protein